MDDFEELKTTLKSLVQSSPHPINIMRLNMDYKDMEGKDIQFRKFGHSSLESLLHSMPDAIYIIGGGPGAMVKHVPNAKSKHISDMVRTQKKTKLPKKAAAFMYLPRMQATPAPRYTTHRTYAPPRMNSVVVVPPQYHQQPQRPQYNNQQYQQPARAVPQHYNQQAAQAQRATPQNKPQQPVRSAPPQYSQQAHQSLQAQQPVRSAPQQYSQQAHQSQQSQKAAPQHNTQQIRQPTALQHSDRLLQALNPKANNAPSSSESTRNMSQNTQSQSLSKDATQQNNGTTVSGASQAMKQQQQEPDCSRNGYGTVRAASTDRSRTPSQTKIALKSANEIKGEFFNADRCVEKSPKVNLRIQINNEYCENVGNQSDRSVTRADKLKLRDPIPSSQNASSSRVTIKTEKDFEEYDRNEGKSNNFSVDSTPRQQSKVPYQNDAGKGLPMKPKKSVVIDPRVIDLTKDDDDDEFYGKKRSAVTRKTSAYIDLTAQKDDRSSRTRHTPPYEVKRDRQRLAESFVEGNQSIRSTNIFVEDFELENPEDKNAAVPKSAVKNMLFHCDFPEDTAKFCDRIESVPFPHDLQVGATTQIYVSEIHSAYKFWFQLQEQTMLLRKMMIQLHKFYSPLQDQEFCIPPVCIVRGQLCGAVYNDVWHRGLIVSEVVNNSAKVFFVDFGTVSDVPISGIKFLPKVFTKTPRLAMRGSFSHIKPAGLHWSHDATKYLVSILSNKLLHAKVSELNKENECFYLVLVEANEPEDVQINRNLIAKGYAELDCEWKPDNIKKHGERKHHPREDYPTFPMLEDGDYPSFHELMVLLARGIDYEKIADSIMYHPGRFNRLKTISDNIRQLPFQLLNTNPFRGEIISGYNKSTLHKVEH